MRRELDVISEAGVERQGWGNAPGILPESSQRLVRETVCRTSIALDKFVRETKPVTLYRRKAGEGGTQTSRQPIRGAKVSEPKRSRIGPAKVVKAAVVHREGGGE